MVKSAETRVRHTTSPSARDEKRTVPWVLIVAILALMGAGGWIAYHRHAEAAADATASGKGSRPSNPVVVQQASHGDMPVRLSALGTVTARNTVTVRVQVSGRLDQVLFREGQTVRAGQVLARIDPRTYQTQVDSAVAQLAKDQAQLDAAEIDLKRYQTLLSQDSIASQQVDTQAALVGQLKGSVAADRASLAQTRLQLGYTQVTAPINGRAGLRQVDAGNLVQTSDTSGLVVITEVQPISIVFPLPQQQLPAVLTRQQSGDTLSIEAWDADNQKLLATGVLTSIDNQIDSTTGTVKLKAQFDNTDNALFPNQFVNIRLIVNTLENAVLAPTPAVQPGRNGNFVFVVDTENKAHMRPVKVGPSDGNKTAILDGLKANEQVVTDGVDRIRDGATVQVMTQRDTPSAPPAGSGNRSGRRRHRPDDASAPTPGQSKAK